MKNFAMPQSAALLLEGGSLRGLYTAGALDTLMEEDLYFPAVAGVSAGALNGVNYVAHELGRSASINLRYRKDPRYFGPMAAFNGGSLFGLNFMLRDIPQMVPFDSETFYHGGQRMVAVATCLQTGKAAYFEKGKTDFDFLDAVRASASLPLVSVPVHIGKFSYLDGGCSCPIPLEWAQTEGFAKIVIITTRHKGFRKTMPGQRMINLYDDFYGDKTLFLATLLTQEVRYNALMDQIDALEEAGKIFVLRPAQPIEIGRFEKNTERLLDLYNRGRREMRDQLDALQTYLEA
ncbi:patatin family protein [uncultured Subdoligranulum sp.]|uniref:patatin-like phospholipase family protein n=1 Tax=uncultured Subdoligranulum sp. TaxID=512298 RepID=UPI0026393237|nr:patatin family protein [uncultured Subdoligranulum sp.]